MEDWRGLKAEGWRKRQDSNVFITSTSLRPIFPAWQDDISSESSYV